MGFECTGYRASGTWVVHQVPTEALFALRGHCVLSGKGLAVLSPRPSLAASFLRCAPVYVTAFRASELSVFAHSDSCRRHRAKKDSNRAAPPLFSAHRGKTRANHALSRGRMVL